MPFKGDGKPTTAAGKDGQDPGLKVLLDLIRTAIDFQADLKAMASIYNIAQPKNVYGLPFRFSLKPKANFRSLYIVRARSMASSALWASS